MLAGGSTDPNVLAAAAVQRFGGMDPAMLQAVAAMLLSRKVFPTYYSGGESGYGTSIPGDPVISGIYVAHDDQGSYSYELAASVPGSSVNLTWTFPALLVNGLVEVPGVSGTPGGTSPLVFYGGQNRWPVRGFIIQRNETNANMPSNHYPVPTEVFNSPLPVIPELVSFHYGIANTDVAVSGNWFTNMTPYAGDENWVTIKSYGPQFCDQLPTSYSDATAVYGKIYAYRAVIVIGPFGIPSAGGTWYTEINWNVVQAGQALNLTATAVLNTNGSFSHNLIQFDLPTSFAS